MVGVKSEERAALQASQKLQFIVDLIYCKPVLECITIS